MPRAARVVELGRSAAGSQNPIIRIWLRGDTDFSLTHNFDRWDERVGFVFGYDAKRNLIEMADALPENTWKPLQRPARYEVKTDERRRPENVKEQVIKEREYKNIRLESEQVSEFDYRPTHCSKSYRMVVVRKNLTIEKGETRLFDEVRYNSESPIIPSG